MGDSSTELCSGQTLTLLGAPVLKELALDRALHDKINQHQTAISHLNFLHAHDTLVILKNSLSMPRLLYLLRTSDCHDYPLLLKFDATFRYATLTPALYHLTLSTYSCELTMVYHEHIILSSEGSQHCDPPGPWNFVSRFSYY